jgi:hypothetical protein
VPCVDRGKQTVTTRKRLTNTDCLIVTSEKRGSVGLLCRRVRCVTLVHRRTVAVAGDFLGGTGATLSAAVPPFWVRFFFRCWRISSPNGCSVVTSCSLRRIETVLHCLHAADNTSLSVVREDEKMNSPGSLCSDVESGSGSGSGSGSRLVVESEEVDAGSPSLSPSDVEDEC